MNEIQGQQILNELKATRKELAELREMILSRWSEDDDMAARRREMCEEALANTPEWRAKVEADVVEAKRKQAWKKAAGRSRR